MLFISETITVILRKEIQLRFYHKNRVNICTESIRDIIIYSKMYGRREIHEKLDKVLNLKDEYGRKSKGNDYFY